MRSIIVSLLILGTAALSSATIVNEGQGLPIQHDRATDPGQGDTIEQTSSGNGPANGRMTILPIHQAVPVKKRDGQQKPPFSLQYIYGHNIGKLQGQFLKASEATSQELKVADDVLGLNKQEQPQGQQRPAQGESSQPTEKNVRTKGSDKKARGDEKSAGDKDVWWKLF